MVGMSAEFIIIRRVGWRQSEVLRRLLSLRLSKVIIDLIGRFTRLILHECLVVLQLLTLLFKKLAVYLLKVILKLSLFSIGLQFQSIHVKDIKN